jgi:hypothetical protein
MACEAYGNQYVHVDGLTYEINQLTCHPVGLEVGNWAYFTDLEDFPRVKNVWIPGLTEEVTLEPQHGIAGAYEAATGSSSYLPDFAKNPNFLLWAGVAAVAAFWIVRR